MKKSIVILLVLCLLVPNAYAMEKEEISTYAGVLLLSLAAIAGGAYSIYKATTSEDETSQVLYGILGAFLLYGGTSGLIEYSIAIGRAKRGIESKNYDAFLTVGMHF